MQCIQDEDLTPIININCQGNKLIFSFKTNNGEICFVCPLDVEALPEDVVNSRAAKILGLLWPLTCLHYCFPDL